MNLNPAVLSLLLFSILACIKLLIDIDGHKILIINQYFRVKARHRATPQLSFLFIKIFNISLLALLLTSCGKSLPELKGIDRKVWREDKGACLNHRSAMAEALKTEKEKLLALSEMQMVELLGMPDENELYKRNQKFYSYYLEPSEACGSTGSKEAARLVIRFNAMGLAKEVSVE